ncbi:uncharacterized protein LOC144705150 [Wolffia australiana]
MEDGFKARVERLFGSHLFETVPKSSFPESSWSVVEGEVEKKEWNRERGETHPGREETPLASAYDGCFAKKSRNSEERRFAEDLEESEDREEEKADEDGEGDEFDREERDIRSSIGLDSTLDFEEEEDEYDRRAVGMGEIGERLYMKDVKDHGPYINYHSIIEETSEELIFSHDPRADHAAASARIKEDTTEGAPIRSTSSIETAGVDSDNIKPILKRKTEQEDARPKKQVRFDRPTAMAEVVGDPQIRTVDPRIPDYLRNPSKYVCYSLESDGNLDDTSNRQAFSDFWEIVKRRKGEDLEAAPLPRSVAFTPRKQASDRKAPVSPPARPVSAAAMEEEDEIQDDVPAGGSLRPTRHYRSRPISEN